MTNSFDNEKFDEAIRNKNVRQIESLFIAAIWFNPGFYPGKGQKISEVEAAMDKLEREFPEALKKYELKDGEKAFNEKDSDSWDKEYFFYQTHILGENFCRQRLNNIKKIGQQVMRAPEEHANANFQKPQEQESIEGKVSTKPRRLEASNSLPIPALVAGGVFLLLMILVVILIKR